MKRSLRAFTAKDGRKIVLRELTPADLGPLLRYANAMVREKKTNRELGVAFFDKRLTREFEKGFLDRTMESTARGEAVHAAAFDRGAMIGLCTVSRRGPADIRHTGLLGISVVDGYRGVGLGEELMREVMDAAKRKGIWLVELEVMATNRVAVHLYEELGFRKVGVIPNKFLRDGRHIDVMVMYADLRGTDKFTPRRRGKS